MVACLEAISFMSKRFYVKNILQIVRIVCLRLHTMHLMYNSLFTEKYNIWLQNYDINSCKNVRDFESLETLGV